MSYSCSYHCFDPKTADQKWQSEDLSKFARYDDEDLLQYDLELGSVCSVALGGSEYADFSALLEAHDITFDDYPKREDISLLLSKLDATKARNLFQSDEASQYEADIRQGFDSVLQMSSKILKNDDSDEIEYSIDEIQKYVVPLYEASGILLYSKVSKQQVREFNTSFSTEVYEKAVSSVMEAYTSAVDGVSKDTEEMLVKKLVTFKNLIQTLDNNPSYVFVFSDSETDLPVTVQNRLEKIKGLL